MKQPSPSPHGVRDTLSPPPRRLPWLLLALLLSLAAPTHAQPFSHEPGWTELHPFTVIRSADRVHRIRVRDTTPVDLLHLGVGGVGLYFESLEVTLADGTTQTLDIRRSFNHPDIGAYLVLCGGPQVIRSARLRHAPGDPRYNTLVSLHGRARTPSTTGALELPCESRADAIPSAEPIPGYLWGATMEEVRARCTAAGGTVAQPRPSELTCTPFAPLAATSARFTFRVAAPTGLDFIEVTRTSVPRASLQEAVRREIAPWLARLGRPRIRARPDNCDVAFYDTPTTCITVSHVGLQYTWSGAQGLVMLETDQRWDQGSDFHVIRLRFTREE